MIRKLPETVNEELHTKLNAIIEDHLKINDIGVKSVKRIPNTQADSAVPGVVVATLDSEANRDRILKAKYKLNNTVYKDVYLYPDQTKEELLTAGNMRVLVNAEKNRGRV